MSKQVVFFPEKIRHEICLHSCFRHLRYIIKVRETAEKI
jgi:hypothetical protein